MSVSSVRAESGSAQRFWSVRSPRTSQRCLPLSHSCGSSSLESQLTFRIDPVFEILTSRNAAAGAEFQGALRDLS